MERPHVQERHHRSSGGTGKERSTSFSDRDRDDGKHDSWFNFGSQEWGGHGHVVTSNDGQTTHYARDVDGNTYVDDSKSK
jgi:hypothetical protein